MAEVFKVRNMMILEEDARKTVKIGDDTFVVKAVFPVDRASIARQVSMYQNGMPANSFAYDDRVMFERNAILDICIVEKPEWWQGWAKCPDEEVLETLHSEILAWNNEFQEKLKKNRLGKGSQGGQVSG